MAQYQQQGKGVMPNWSWLPEPEPGCELPNEQVDEELKRARWREDIRSDSPELDQYGNPLSFHNEPFTQRAPTGPGKIARAARRPGAGRPRRSGGMAV
jgi:hypothetical protein